jgi:uncharacterized protein YbjT (DUF2867 family)
MVELAEVTNRERQSIEADVPILVIGSTGKTGRRVMERLEALGLPVRGGSRSADPPFDWEDQSTWAPALQDMKSVYLTYYPDIAVPGSIEAIRVFVDLAVEAGVQRLVLLAGRGEEEADRAELAVRESSLNWTILRPTWFAQNFSEMYWRELVIGGEVVLPAGDVGEPFVDVDDIADVAVAALTEERHTGQTYELTGPRSLTFAEAVREIAEATGREVRYVKVTPEEYESILKEQDVPADFIWLLNYLFTNVLDGRNSHLADGVQRALGREPKDFADYARETAATGVWDA